MKLFFSFLLIFSVSSTVFSQTSAFDNAVLTQASINAIDTSITIKWAANQNAIQYNIYRKIYGANGWGAPIASLAASVLSFTDSLVLPHQLYEYKIMRIANSVNGYGYLVSGINTQLNYNKGKLILVIDDYFIPNLQAEIDQLIIDLEADGWFVQQQLVNRNDNVTQVKSLIQSMYSNDPLETKTIFLLGHVPVPYSGDLNPDGHPDHLGAWPADVFYADMDGIWTDNSVNDFSASDPRNQNIPNDGKMDQSVLPSDLELEISRVDFYMLPTFAETESQLMISYLNKLHDFKTRQYIPQDSAVVEDNFGGMAEGFSGAALAGLSPLVGINEVKIADYTSTLLANDFLWAYGAGGGWYSGASGIASTSDFATNNYKSTFSMLFGSYFGDWDATDNFMRASLASGKTLTCSWSGRPFIYYHQLSMGNHLGQSIKAAQNNISAYFSSTLNTFTRWIHIAQLGDPSLRIKYIAPPTNLVGTTNSSGTIDLSWLPSSETVLGYNVYRRLPNVFSWELLNSNIISGTTYTDNSIVNGGNYLYMVRATDTLTSASGSYYNLSLGAFGSGNATASNVDLLLLQNVRLAPNPALDFTTLMVHESSIGKNYKVLNLFGNQIASGVLKDKINKINIDFFPSGIYLIQIEGFSSTLKLIKN